MRWVYILIASNIYIYICILIIRTNNFFLFCYWYNKNYHFNRRSFGGSNERKKNYSNNSELCLQWSIPETKMEFFFNAKKLTENQRKELLSNLMDLTTISYYWINNNTSIYIYIFVCSGWSVDDICIGSPWYRFTDVHGLCRRLELGYWRRARLPARPVVRLDRCNNRAMFGRCLWSSLEPSCYIGRSHLQTNFTNCKRMKRNTENFPIINIIIYTNLGCRGLFSGRNDWSYRWIRFVASAHSIAHTSIDTWWQQSWLLWNQFEWRCDTIPRRAGWVRCYIIPDIALLLMLGS